MKESRYTKEWVMSHIGMRHVTHMHETCHTHHVTGAPSAKAKKKTKKTGHKNGWMSLRKLTTNMNERVTYTKERVVSYIGMSHVTYMNESCRMYEWVMPHIWMSHATHVIPHTHTSCHTEEWAYMNESCHIYEWVLSHVWMSHVTYMNESCHARHTTHTHVVSHRGMSLYEWVMLHIWMSHVTHVMPQARLVNKEKKLARLQRFNEALLAKVGLWEVRMIKSPFPTIFAVWSTYRAEFWEFWGTIRRRSRKSGCER